MRVPTKKASAFVDGVRAQIDVIGSDGSVAWQLEGLADAFRKVGITAVANCLKENAIKLRNVAADLSALCAKEMD